MYAVSSAMHDGLGGFLFMFLELTEKNKNFNI